MALLSINSIQGKRDYMEDRYAYLNQDGIIITMVCDGHGGSNVANKTAKELPIKLFSVLRKDYNTNVAVAEAIRNVIIEWGESLVNEKSGSTLTGIAVKNGIIFVYNIGDSRTCIKLKPESSIFMLKPLFDHEGKFIDRIIVDFIQKDTFCTIDHDPDTESERMRVAAARGVISQDRLNGILSVTRALGDGDIGSGLSHVPDIFWTKVENICGPAFLFSDGIYEPQRYQSTADFTNDYLYNLAVDSNAETVVRYAYENGSDDNLTAVIVDLRQL